MDQGTLGSPGPHADPESVTARLASVRGRILAAGGDPARVRVVAVTKGFGVEACRAALQAGLADLGENYAGELIEKAVAVGEPCRWHFLGAVQRNKVARLARHVALWQGVDRAEEGEAILEHAGRAQVLVEVDTTGLPERGGVAPEEVEPLVERLRHLGLDVRGLMTVAPPPGLSPGGAERAFETLAGLGSRLEVEELSMGMSDDFELAVARGSTMVRLGRALFGPRPGPGGMSQ